MSKDRPPLVVVSREGDARGALGVAVATGGIAADRGASVAVALAGLMEARLDAAGLEDATVVAGWDGYRVRALVTAASAPAAVNMIRTAMLTPASAREQDTLAAAQRKLDALAERPMADVALLDSVRCTGEAFAIPSAARPPSLRAEELEEWRHAAHGLGRVAFASVGSEALGDAAASAIAREAIWPAGAPSTAPPWPTLDARAEVYDASAAIPAGSARITLAAHTTSALRALSPAYALGDPRGPLSSRLGALDAPGRVKSVTATAHPGEGCISMTFDLAARDLTSDASGRIATAAALARQELSVELSEVNAAAEGEALAPGGGDPRDAAERAAWWALARRPSPAPADLRFSLAIGIAGGRDAPPSSGANTWESALARQAEAIRRDLDLATVAWRAPVVEARARVERGQGDLWILLASTCGALAEVDDDAGLGAAVSMATAAQASRAEGAGLAEVEPWVTTEGIGIVVHGPPLPGESPAAHARRLADLAARAFAADPIDASFAAEARGTLLGRATLPEGRVLSALADALAPGHATWFAPLGTARGLGHASDAAVTLRGSAMRAGPLRVAVLANVDAAQSEVAVRAIDRWVARRPGEARTCPAAATAPPPRTGTYAVEAANAGRSEAWLAFPLPAPDGTSAPHTAEAPAESAAWVAAALDGDDGLLAHALGDGGLADSWSARVIGTSRSAALVVRVVAMEGSLDAAVAQTRALFERLRRGALSDADRTHAASVREDENLAGGLDPRARLIALFRGTASASPAPSLATLRAFCASALNEDALVIAAARPPHGGS